MQLNKKPETPVSQACPYAAKEHIIKNAFRKSPSPVKFMRPYFIHQSVYDDVFTADKNYYRKTTKRLKFPKLTDEKDYDVIIVGGGLSGLATAYYLTQKHGRKVALLERHFIGWGASGRNGGQILPGYMAPATRMLRNFGFDKTKMLWDISVTGVNNILSLIEKHKINCDLAPGAITPICPAHHNLPSIETPWQAAGTL